MILYSSLTVDRIWTIWEAHAPFTSIIAAARRVKGTDEAGWLKELMLRGASDFPQVALGVGDSFGGEPFRVATFSQEPLTLDPANGDWIAKVAETFKAKFIYRDLVQASDDYRKQLEMAAMTALVAEGRDLGLSYISSWAWQGKWGKEVYESAKGTTHPVTTITITVQYDLDGNQLLP